MTKPVRQRNSELTRQKLMSAAGELFGERGYERTTIRDIGERAGVDSALIARYFGNKAALYLATLPADPPQGANLADILDPGRIADVVRRVHELGPSPVIQAVVRAHDDPAVQAAAADRVDARLVRGLEERMRDTGLGTPRLRAQIAVAALAGIALGRASRTLDELADADQDAVVDLTVTTLRSLLEGDAGPSGSGDPMQPQQR